MLYQLTDTPDVSEMLSDHSVDDDGQVRVVWAQADGLVPGHSDVYSATIQLPMVDDPNELPTVCPLFDQTRAHRVRSVVPIKVAVCDGDGRNVSSPDVAVTAVGLRKVDDSPTSTMAEDAGNANPDGNFRYDTADAVYHYNLSTRDLTPGTWELLLTVVGDARTHTVRFDLR